MASGFALTAAGASSRYCNDRNPTVNLTAADVAEIMRLVEESNFDELNLDINGVKLVLRRTGSRAPAAFPAGSPARAAAPVFTPRQATASGAIDANLKDIISPLLGTFYRAPKPGSPPFVEVGSAVDEDSVIAIVEVMKLMNTVRAGVKGVITEILPADESLVEFGDVLMRARPDV
jgi:acetyl-CoA carboxylase biotin carboxyl carrier protein